VHCLIHALAIHFRGVLLFIIH